jgi:competence protein ComEC
VSLIAIPANVIVAPLYEATVFVAALAAFVGVNDAGASATRLLLSFVPGAFILVEEVLASVPGREFPVRDPLAIGAGWYAGLTGVTWLLDRCGARPPALEPAPGTSFGWSHGLAVVTVGLWLMVLRLSRPDARVTVLDVGHGLSVLIEDGGQRVLLDTGPPDGSVLLALPAEVTNLGAILVSHADSDHAGGLAPLFDRIPVEAHMADGRTIEDLGVRLPLAGFDGQLDSGDRIYLSERTMIEVLSPHVVTRGRTHDSDNDGPMVIRVTIGERIVLVTADIDSAAGGWLLKRDVDLEADVLLIPHHGSKTSSTAAFVEAVGPRAAVLSVSATNRYGHPAPEMMDRYEGVPVFRTGDHGNVTVTSDGDRLWVSTER